MLLSAAFSRSQVCSVRPLLSVARRCMVVGAVSPWWDLLYEFARSTVSGVAAAAAVRCPACPPHPPVSVACPAPTCHESLESLQIYFVLIVSLPWGVLVAVVCFALGYICGRRGNTRNVEIGDVARAQLTLVRRHGENR